MTAFLISFLLRSMLLGALGLAALRLLRHKSASVQHAIAVGTVSAMIALPLLSSLLPTRTVEISRVPEALAYLTVTRVSESGITTSSPHLVQAARFDGSAVVPALWLTVAVLLLLRLGAGFLWMRGRVAKSRELLFGRVFPVVEDRGTKVPMVVWMGRSRVLLPKSWSSWPGEQLDHVLAHEEAHLRRRDWFSQMFVRLAAIAMWPNPIAHVLVRITCALAEQAADDLVLSSGVDPAVYASSLLEVARGVVAAPAYAVPMAAKADVARRIEMILNKNKQRGAVSLHTLVVVGLALAVVSGPMACWALKPDDGAHPGAPSPGRQNSVFGAAVPVMLLNQKDVHADLGLGSDQIQAINELLDRYRQERRLLRRNSPAGAVNASLNAATGRYLVQLEAVLTSKEKVRLNQIFLQWRKNDAVLEPDVQMALGITPTQKSRIRDIALRYQQGNKDLYQRLSAGNLTPSALPPLQQALNTSYEANLGKVLTPSQSSRLEALGGNPFTGNIMGTIWTVGD